MKNNPVPPQERDECLSKIAGENPAADNEFWNLLFDSEED
jgi:hypothetical protein